MSGEAPDRPSAGSAEPPCVIEGCGEASVRSLARAEVRKAFPSLSEEGRRAPLCRAHYKQYKKATKESRALQRLDW